MAMKFENISQPEATYSSCDYEHELTKPEESHENADRTSIYRVLFDYGFSSRPGDG
jgi:hypothetical protein